VAKTKN